MVERGQGPRSFFDVEASPETLARTTVGRWRAGTRLNLEQSLKLFEEGVRLSRASQATLDGAEKRVEELLSIDEHGEPVVREIDVE